MFHNISVIVPQVKAIISGHTLECFHVIDERIDQEMSVLLHVNELEVEATALVW